MIMGVPFFLMYSVYGVINVYLPILLSNLGYSPSLIGLLQGIFEASGLLFPLFVSSKVDKKGNYGLVMVLLGILMVIVLPPLTLSRTFFVTALMLALFAIGYKGVIPVGDALASRILGPESSNYGKVRVLGSIGFVCITLVMQFTPMISSDSSVSITFWAGVFASAFTLSIILIPGLLKKIPPEIGDTAVNQTQSKGIKKLAEFPFPFWIGILLIFLGFLGLTPSQRFFSLYVKNYLHLDNYAGLWALSAMAEVPFMFFSGYFIRKYGSEKIILISLLTIVARNSVYALFPSFQGAIAGQLFHSICFGLFHPAAVIFVSERVPQRLMAFALTLYSSVSVGLASVLGNFMGGFIIDYFGYRMLFVIFSIFPIIGFLIFVRFKNLFRIRPLLTQPFSLK